ncbi:MAG: chromate transporter [Spirochaetales bacterium]|nr:chromate transporter [Spirochaetales bacterium]MBQ3697949.1 chromate transporter [Spirochaetales bacterium]MBQ9810197.1 chromate transporter [Spirochaetales bacterium]MBR4478342.1 chromate transporter [Spirochaetales bacterium]MCR5442223.1 chromate transporter [Sphaerochaetaceae bacterium]
MHDKKPRASNVLWMLFSGMFYISAFTFGGGFVIATFVKKKFSDELGWIDESEMLDLIALAQSAPGAIAVNVAILVGWKVFGVIGMIASVLGTILPPMIILTAVSFIYNLIADNMYVAMVLKGMQAGVAAIILSVSIDLAVKVMKEKSILYDALIVAAFVLSFFFKVNVVFLIIAALLLGVALAFFRRKGALR